MALEFDGQADYAVRIEDRTMLVPIPAEAAKRLLAGHAVEAYLSRGSADRPVPLQMYIRVRVEGDRKDIVARIVRTVGTEKVMLR